MCHYCQIKLNQYIVYTTIFSNSSFVFCKERVKNEDSRKWKELASSNLISKFFIILLGPIIVLLYKISCNFLTI